MAMGWLDGRVAIVTGAGRGIGAAVATMLAAEGAAVVVNDLGADLDGTGADSTPAQSVVAAIGDAGGSAVVDGADVGDHTEAETLVRKAVEQFGRLDVLVNVAGILRDRMIFNMSEQDWDAVIRVHLKGTFNTIRHASAHWREVRDETAHHRIINFTSDTGLFGGPTQPNYAAAKMGIVGLTLSCANALVRYGVTANAVAPVADTRMTADLPESIRRSSQSERSPEAVARLVTFLASEASSWCSGRVLGVRGNELSLYTNPQIVRQVTSHEPWSLDEMAGALERHFRPVPPGAEGRYDHQRVAKGLT